MKLQKDLLMGDSKHSLHLQGQVTIDMLTDDALLEIFDFCRAIGTSELETDEMEDPMWWEALVHVCQRWRKLIFASPRRLDLHVTCSRKTHTRTSLDIWPPFPIMISSIWYYSWYKDDDDDENIIAALEHRDRIDEILFRSVPSRALERFITVMQEPLVALTKFRIESTIEKRRSIILPEAFFSVSAPNLRSFSSSGISFPSLPDFIISARDLVDLRLEDIPDFGYIAPEVIVANLAPLPNLKHLSIGFDYPQHFPIQGNPPPPPRAVFPALSLFSFTGINKYLEDFVARIDTPLLNKLKLTFRGPIHHTQQLDQFFARTERLKLFNQAQVVFYGSSRKIILEGPSFDLEVYSSELTAVIFSSLVSYVARLDVRSTHSTLAMPGDLVPVQLLELFCQFSAVQCLYVSANMNALVVAALNESTGDSAKEVLPALRELFLERLEQSRSLWEAIQLFVTARQRSDHPVAIDIQSWGDIFTTDSDDDSSEDGSSSEDEDEDHGGPNDDEPQGNPPGGSTLTND